MVLVRYYDTVNARISAWGAYGRLFNFLGGEGGANSKGGEGGALISFINF